MKPILFSTPLVKAILNDTKNQTRRIKKTDNPKYEVGDTLWVRETWAVVKQYDKIKPSELQKDLDTRYKTDLGGEFFRIGEGKIRKWGKWRPSIFLPKGMHRIELEVTAVRVERLKDIGEQDAIGEGVIKFDDGYENYMGQGTFKSPVSSFLSLWLSVYGIESVGENPELFVYNFKTLKK